MNKNPVLLTLYTLTHKAANDDGWSTSAVHLTPAASEDAEGRISRGWDPFEVWRTRIRPALERTRR